jgi:hypothetical protein
VKNPMNGSQDRLKKTETVFCMLTGILCLMALFMLFYITIKGTYYTPLDDSLQYQSDFIPWNILAIIIFLMIFSYVCKATGGMKERIIIAAAVITEFLVCCLWIRISHVMPQVDQNTLCDAAMQFNSGDFNKLARDGYVNEFRQQLGFITFLRMIFLISGGRNYWIVQYINAAAAAAILFCNGRIAETLGESRHAKTNGVLLSFFAYPILFYTAFVYGELISTALYLLIVLEVLSLLKKFQWKKCIIAGLAMGVAVQLRENILIALIAIVICLLFRAVSVKSRTALMVAGSLIIGTIGLQMMTNQIYASHFTEGTGSMPASLHIAMGMMDGEYGPGWYNDYNRQTFRKNNYDVQAADQEAKAAIRTRMQYFKEHPSEMQTFYYTKISTQWNNPMYESILLNNMFYSEPVGFAYEIYYGDMERPIDIFMNYFQGFVYFMMLLYLIYMVRHKAGMEYYIIPLTVLGGFLFSILWEAKSRYVFPYFVMMLPCAAVMIDKINRKIGPDPADVRPGTQIQSS